MGVRVRVGALTLAAAALAAAGCGAGDDPSVADQPDAPAAPEDLGVGAMYFGECGSVPTEEFAQLTGLGGVQPVERNSVGCRWESAAGLGGHGSFSWYRGSPIERERTLVELVGRTPEELEIGPMRGYVAQDGALCEVGMASGNDFFVWSVLYPEDRAAGDVCGPVRELARLTVERAQ